MNSNDLLKQISITAMKIAKIVLKITIYIVVVFFIGTYFFNFGKRLFLERSMTDKENKKEVIFTITDKDTVSDIAKKLVDEGLIDDELAFKFRANIYKINFRRNTYLLDTSMTIKNMLDIFDDANSSYIQVTENAATEEDYEYDLSPEEETEEQAD